LSTKRLNSGLAALAAARSFSALPLFTTSSSQMQKKKMLQKFWSNFYGKQREKHSAKKKKKKTISVPQRRSSEGRKREKFCLRSTFFSFEETEEKRVRLVGTSLFFFANLEGLAKFGYKAKYVSRISLNFYLYFWLPN
jgi:hypothetical protein